jgi:hypothetical protein
MGGSEGRVFGGENGICFSALDLAAFAGWLLAEILRLSLRRLK